MLARDVVTLLSLETMVRDAGVEMKRERSEEERREAELALVASGLGRSGGGIWRLRRRGSRMNYVAGKTKMHDMIV